MKILSWFDIYFQGFSRQDFHQSDRKEKQGYKIPPFIGDFEVYILFYKELSNYYKCIPGYFNKNGAQIRQRGRQPH